MNDIKYYLVINKCTEPANNTVNVYILKKFVFHPNSNDIDELIEINLTASDKYITYQITETNDHWLKNLSSTLISKEIKSLLQLGENFYLPNYNIMNITIDFIKHIEYNFMRLIIPKITEMRNKIFPLLKDIKNVSKGLTNIENDILSLLASTKTFLKNNSNIIFTRMDKGNIIVTLDKHEYIQKM